MLSFFQMVLCGARRNPKKQPDIQSSDFRRPSAVSGLQAHLEKHQTVLAVGSASQRLYPATSLWQDSNLAVLIIDIAPIAPHLESRSAEAALNAKCSFSEPIKVLNQVSLLMAKPVESLSILQLGL